ncbi:tripartite tricarboxylate transporter substrate binding protein [Pelagibius sp. Alg239-R121]|uniref:tripartite tricarboxylate transporter substrate binding protein n=1 Tax=Pelagibius sp. Alg239-R121 TaxID=2993448 RepID=UPI0024A7562F|nr:tripartite tricarboxylate transporter substrate binding protein [Pelagibius sp. Alg239-R121]
MKFSSALRGQILRGLTRRGVMSRGFAFSVAALAGIAGVTGTTQVQAEYPEKPVTLVIPYKAGGSTETMARVYSKALAKELGAKVIVKTRPGAGGAVGATEVAAAAADGHTLLFAASTSLLWPPLTQKVEFDLDSFVYVGQITEYQQAIVAKADAPFNTLQELIAHAKENGLNYADQSAMSRAYINYIGGLEGVTWTGIPTKGGGEMVPFLLGGKIDFAWSGGIHNRYGSEMKVLASMNGTRLLASPDTPSIAELYGISMPSQAVIVVPKGTPADVVAKLESAMERASSDADFSDLVTNKLKFPVKFVGSDALAKDIAQTLAGLKTVVEKTQ